MNLDDYILGDPQFHAELRAITEILIEFISTAPRSLSSERLALYTGHATSKIAAVCEALEWEGLVVRDRVSLATWSLARSPGTVTLEDAFRVTLALQTHVKQTEPRKSTLPGVALRTEIGLLLMQATIGIQQNLHSYLRQIPLGPAKCTRASSAKHQNASQWPFPESQGTDIEAFANARSRHERSEAYE